MKDELIIPENLAVVKNECCTSLFPSHILLRLDLRDPALSGRIHFITTPPYYLADGVDDDRRGGCRPLDDTGTRLNPKPARHRNRAEIKIRLKQRCAAIEIGLKEEQFSYQSRLDTGAG